MISEADKMSDEVIIRNVTKEDADTLIKIYDYYVKNTAITFEYETPTKEEFTNRIIKTVKKYPYFVILVDGEIKGYAYAGAFKERAAYNWSAELSIYLEHGSEKKGFGKKLYECLEAKLKEMGILNLYACIAYPEKEDEYLTRNSAAFHEHMGCAQVGLFHKCGYKFNRWYDMIWMEKIIGEHK